MTATMQDTATARILIELLTENTGRAMCDSGGTPKYDEQGRYIGSEHGYGRMYERNAGRAFEAEDDASLTIDEHEVSVTTRVFHWLKERLEFAPSMDEKFQDFANSEEQENESWMQSMLAYVDHLRDLGHDVTGLYGDGDPDIVYTYNHQNNLDQDIQFLYFEMDDEKYILLQTHNGCDARGGMSRARAFKMSDYSDGAEMFGWSDATIQCSEDHDHYWRTDDAYHYYAEGACGRGAGTQLEDYDREEIELPEDVDDAAIQVAARLQDEKKLYFTNDGRAFCPICGGLLSACMM
jgi:hypothetical protein